MNQMGRQDGNSSEVVIAYSHRYSILQRALYTRLGTKAHIVAFSKLAFRILSKEIRKIQELDFELLIIPPVDAAVLVLAITIIVQCVQFQSNRLLYALCRQAYS